MNLSLRACVLWTAAIVAALAVLHSKPAQAGLQFCNRTSYVLYAALGVQAQSAMQTQGWTRIAPGSCQTAIPQSLSVGPYYVLARTAQAHTGAARIWGGQTQLCAKDTNFSLKSQIGSPNCPSDDAFPMPFAVLDTHAMRTWTMTFTESPALASMEAARIAGLKRLLRDNGFKIASSDGKPDKAADAALVLFRKRMKLADNAGPEDLFDALETEALKIAAPAGYSVCNDTNETVWTSVGLKNGSDWVSRGWWTVSPGSCAKAISTPLSAEKVYVLVERKGGKPFIAGNTKFCVADIQFEIYGRDRCSSRGLTEAGFAETSTKGVAGYSAHISDEGLVPPLALQPAIPK
jgi:uncharacterized membrane protein